MKDMDMSPLPSDSVVRVGISGVTGRIGLCLKNLLDQGLYPELIYVGGLSRSGAADGAVDTATALVKLSDIVIDFSSPALLPDLVAAAMDDKKPILIATTGHDDEHHALIQQASHHIPLLVAANTSLGITVLQIVAQQAASLLGGRFDIEILEAHHRRKVDSPSGTALALANALETERDAVPPSSRVFIRHGQTGPRPKGSIGFSVIRGGSVAGDHTVFFLGDGERVELTHRAESPELFARGALVAAQWLVRQPPGLYAMQDVLLKG